MRNTLRLLAITVLLIPAFVAAQKPYAEGELMIQLNHKHYSMQDAIAVLENDFQNSALQQTKKLSGIMKIHLFAFDKDTDEHELLENIRKHPAVSEAQFNHRVELRPLPRTQSLTTPLLTSCGDCIIRAKQRRRGCRY
ncbi:MAG: hypothetical protein U5L09_16500 [Bacteroidales bacterium]|nr:hypothetical protein [Bacteroidales bacterium]